MHLIWPIGTETWFWTYRLNGWTALKLYEPWHEISNYVVCATSKGSDQLVHTRRLIRAFACCLNVLWLLSYWPNIIWFSKPKRRLYRLLGVYTCHNATLSEITCRGTYTFDSTVDKKSADDNKSMENYPVCKVAIQINTINWAYLFETQQQEYFFYHREGKMEVLILVHGHPEK